MSRDWPPFDDDPWNEPVRVPAQAERRYRSGCNNCAGADGAHTAECPVANLTPRPALCYHCGARHSSPDCREGLGYNVPLHVRQNLHLYERLTSVMCGHANEVLGVCPCQRPSGDSGPGVLLCACWTPDAGQCWRERCYVCGHRYHRRNHDSCAAEVARSDEARLAAPRYAIEGREVSREEYYERLGGGAVATMMRRASRRARGQPEVEGGAEPQPAAVRGIVLREEGDQLVVQATPDQVRRFTAGAEVDVRPALLAGDSAWALMRVVSGGDGLLYDAAGNPVARVEELVTEMDYLDTTTFGGANRSFATGHCRVRGRFTSL